MAGAFNGNDEDFNQNENEETSEELEASEQSNDDAEENQEELTQQLIEQEQQEDANNTKGFEKFTTNTENELDKRYVPFLTEDESNTIKAGRKNTGHAGYPKHNRRRKQIGNGNIPNSLKPSATIYGCRLILCCIDGGDRCQIQNRIPAHFLPCPNQCDKDPEQ